MITLDRVRLLVPENKVTEVNEEAFDTVNAKMTVKKEILNNVIGVREITYINNSFLLDVSGKITADKGILGLIHKNNIEQVFEKVEDSGILRFNGSPVDDSQVLYLDVTKDVEVENPLETLTAIEPLETLTAIELFATQRKHKNKILPFKNSGLIIKPHAKSVSDSLAIYLKYKEIISNKSPKNQLYIEKIGAEAVEKIKNTVRLERHLGTFKDIRKAFKIDTEKIRLDEILYSKGNPVKDKFCEITSSHEDDWFTAGNEVF